MKILVLDSIGMVGHVIASFFEEDGQDVSRYEQIQDLTQLGKTVTEGKFDAIINCAAIINQYAENDKVSAVQVNTLLPHFLAAVTADTKTVVVHRSTDCIFSGSRGHYTLEDWPDASSFYARSKALGELKNEKDITIRTSLIGPETTSDGEGLFNWFFHQQGTLKGFANAIWSGLTTIEFAREIKYLLQEERHGLFQLVPDYAISKYDLLLLFEKYYPGGRQIQRVENTRVDKSLMPVCGGIKVPGYETMIAEMRTWTDSHAEFSQYR